MLITILPWTYLKIKSQSFCFILSWILEVRKVSLWDTWVLSMQTNSHKSFVLYWIVAYIFWKVLRAVFFMVYQSIHTEDNLCYSNRFIWTVKVIVLWNYTSLQGSTKPLELCCTFKFSGPFHFADDILKRSPFQIWV